MDESDLELQRKAIESLIRDAALWKKKRDRDIRATRLTQFSLNKNFLKNLITRNESFNDRLNYPKESKSKVPHKDDYEASTSKDLNRKNNQGTSHAGSEETYRILNKMHKKRRKRYSSSESLTSDENYISSTSDSSIEVIIAKKRKRRRREKSNKHSRKRRSSSSSSYEALKKHLKKTFSSKYLKRSPQSKSTKRKIERSENTHRLEDSDSYVVVEESGASKPLKTNHQNLSETTEIEKTENDQQLPENQPKEVVKTTKEETSTEIKDSVQLPNTNKSENETNKEGCIKDIFSEDLSTIHDTMISLEDTKDAQDVNQKIETEKIPQRKLYSEKSHSENKKSKSRHKSSHKKMGIHKGKTSEKVNKSTESQEIAKEKKIRNKKINLYSDEEDVFLKIVPITEKEKILNKKQKDDIPKKSTEQDATSQSENNYLEETKKVNLKHDKTIKVIKAEEKKESDILAPEGVDIKENGVISVEGINTTFQEETIILDKPGVPDVDELPSTKVSFALSTKQIKTVEKPAEFQQGAETPDESEKYKSSSKSLQSTKKSKKKAKKRKSKRRSSSSVEIIHSKADIEERKSRSRSKHSYSGRDNSSRSNSRHRDLSRSMSRYSRRDSRTPSSRSYSRSSRCKYRSYTRSRSRSRSDRSYKRYSRSFRDSRSYSRDSRKKYRSSSHSSYSSRSRRSSRSSYRDSRSSSRHRSRKYRDTSTSSRSRRRRSMSFSCVYTDPEKARKYYRRSSISSSSSSSGHSYRKYKRK